MAPIGSSRPGYDCFHSEFVRPAIGGLARKGMAAGFLVPAIPWGIL